MLDETDRPAVVQFIGHTCISMKAALASHRVGVRVAATVIGSRINIAVRRRAQGKSVEMTGNQLAEARGIAPRVVRRIHFTRSADALHVVKTVVLVALRTPPVPQIPSVPADHAPERHDPDKCDGDEHVYPALVAHPVHLRHPG